MTLLIIFLHICAAAVIVAGWRRGEFHLPPVMLPLVILLPVWGPLCAAAAELHFRGGEKADEEPVTGRFGITDEVYRSIRMENDDVSGVLPIEDVLSMGTPAQRRSLLLSVLHTGAEPFVRPLRIAGVNDDTEVVHYAVTALVELRSSFAQRTAELEKKLQERPSDTALLLAYADLDEEYIRSGIPENGEREERLEHCRQMLEKLLQNTAWEEVAAGRGKTLRGARSQNGNRASAAGSSAAEGTGTQGELQRLALLKRLGQVCLQLEDAEQTEEIARLLIGEEPEQESGYLLLLDARVLARDGGGIAQVIDDLRGRDIYLSPAAREKISFWDLKMNRS